MGACCSAQVAQSESTARTTAEENVVGRNNNEDGAIEEDELTEEALFGKRKEKGAKEPLSEEGRHPFRSAAQENTIRSSIRSLLYNKMYKDMTPPEDELAIQHLDNVTSDGAFELEQSEDPSPREACIAEEEEEKTLHIGTGIANYQAIGMDPRLDNRRKRFLRRKQSAHAAAEKISYSISQSQKDDCSMGTEDDLPMCNGITIEGVQGMSGAVEDPLSEDDTTTHQNTGLSSGDHPNQIIVDEEALIVVHQETPQRSPMETKKFGKMSGHHLLAQAGALNLSGGGGTSTLGISPRVGAESDFQSQRNSARPEDRERSFSRRSASSTVAQRFVSFVVVDEREQIAKTQAIAALMAETTTNSASTNDNQTVHVLTPPIPAVPPASILVSARGEAARGSFTPLMSNRGSMPSGDYVCLRSESSSSPTGLSLKGPSNLISPPMRVHTDIRVNVTGENTPKPGSESPYAAQLSVSQSGNSSSEGCSPLPTTNLSYHVSGEPVAYLTEEVERELVRRAERRKKESAIKATILAQLERHERKALREEEGGEEMQRRSRQGSTLKEKFSSFLKLD